MRAIETEFTLTQPSDTAFVDRILGGPDRWPWVARIQSIGDVDFRKID